MAAISPAISATTIAIGFSDIARFNAYCANVIPFKAVDTAVIKADISITAFHATNAATSGTTTANTVSKFDFKNMIASVNGVNPGTKVDIPLKIESNIFENDSMIIGPLSMIACPSVANSKTAMSINCGANSATFATASPSTLPSAVINPDVPFSLNPFCNSEIHPFTIGSADVPIEADNPLNISPVIC